MRKLLSYGEGAFYYYTPTSSNTGPDNPFCTYTIQVSAVPRDDQMYASCYDGTNTIYLKINLVRSEIRCLKSCPEQFLTMMKWWALQLQFLCFV